MATRMPRQAHPARATMSSCIAVLAGLYGANSAQVRSYRAAMARNDMYAELERRAA